MCESICSLKNLPESSCPSQSGTARMRSNMSRLCCRSISFANIHACSSLTDQYKSSRARHDGFAKNRCAAGYNISLSSISLRVQEKLIRRPGRNLAEETRRSTVGEERQTTTTTTEIQEIIAKKSRSRWRSCHLQPTPSSQARSGVSSFRAGGRCSLRHPLRAELSSSGGKCA